eukprot:1160219-Pelagomonas_calceolata.AAC.6
MPSLRQERVLCVRYMHPWQGCCILESPVICMYPSQGTRCKPDSGKLCAPAPSGGISQGVGLEAMKGHLQSAACGCTHQQMQSEHAHIHMQHLHVTKY